MKIKSEYIYLISMIICVVLNVIIRFVGNDSLLNFFAAIISAFVCGLYTSEVMYKDDKHSQSISFAEEDDGK